jgi:hypothetical protein
MKYSSKNYKKIKKSNNKKSNNKTKKMKKMKYIGGEIDEATRNIVSTSIQNRDINLAKMLSMSCKNPDSCLAIGKYADILKTYFDDFRNFSYVDMKKVKRIGTPSVNGFVLEIPFVKNNYTSYTALKCCSKNSADNLFYEFYVGKFFINNYLNIYPCFVETYDFYKINTYDAWDNMKNKLEEFKKSNINNDLTQYDIREDDFHEFKNSCNNNKMNCILIQHFDNFTSFEDEYTNQYNNIKYDLLNLAMQLYFPLCALGPMYTHYDLHNSNVFLYKPYTGKEYILMRYHDIDYRGNEIGLYEFPSEYIVKIIDYGRNYFNNRNIDTNEILQQYVCPAPQCAPRCGETKGYSVIQGDAFDPDQDFHDIMPNKPNKSHDLRFINIYKSLYEQMLQFDDLIYDSPYGTPEMQSNPREPNTIYNIHDFLRILKLHINNWNSYKMQKKYDHSWKQVATIDIYNDGRDYTFAYHK